MEDQDIDLEELDNAYEQDLDKQETQSDAKADDAQQDLAAVPGMPQAPAPAPAPGVV